MKGNFEDVYGFLSMATRIRELQLEPICKKSGLPMSCLNIVQYLSVCGTKNTARDLTRVSGIKSAAFSITIDRLVKDGYVFQEPDETDRRIKHLSLTEKALPITKELRAISKNAESVSLEGIPEEDVKIFCSVLRRATENLTKLKNDIKKANRQLVGA